LEEAYKVSIIIPSYNRASFLKKAITSVLEQTYSNWELLIIDDASSDETKELCDGFCQKDERIKYFRPWDKNKGVSASRNYGIKISSAELIAFLDSDDIWLAKKLEKQINEYKKDPYVLCHSDEIWIRNGARLNQMKKHKKSGGDIFLNCLPLCCISPSASIIRSDVFDKLGLFDESYPVCEDYDLWLRICARYKISFIEEALIIKNGGHSDQLSRASWGNDVYRVKSLVNLINNYYSCKKGKTQIEKNNFVKEYKLGLNLDDEKINASKQILVKKSEILFKGFLKHGDVEKAEYYKGLKQFYSL
jgi:glycosyltransferase involved in cell wall biosynthesis